MVKQTSTIKRNSAPSNVAAARGCTLEGPC
jgi:hypothetical protein